MKNYKFLNNILGWITFVIAATVYLLTIEPSSSFWDCGEFVASAYKMEVGHPPGAPFFMLTANLFTQLASDPTMVPVMVNAMSAIFSALTILLLFWTITHLAKKIIVKEGELMTLPQTIAILGCGLAGALVYTFSDTFWFSAVEGEVYAYSSLFTALVFWLILKWEDVADKPHADRWIILIAYLTGLSIGVHLLNLLCIPAIVLVYYYKKFKNPNMKGTLLALAASFALVGIMMYGVVQGLVEVCGLFELLFVNVIGLPYNFGVYVYVIILAGLLCWGIYETMREEINPVRLKILFILSVVTLGIPFIGHGYWLGLLLIAGLTVLMFRWKKINVKLMNTTLLSLFVIVIGYSSYALILIRATADTPMNQNAPKDIFTLRYYLAREQYGQTPLLYGNTFVSEPLYKPEGRMLVAQYNAGEPVWNRIIKKSESEKDKYVVTNHRSEIKYVDDLNMPFTRMHSQMPNHIEGYKSWSDFKGKPVKFNNGNGEQTVMKPTFGENLTYFFRYQLNFMYWRYFMWNFSGRQNDIQGDGDILNGNWVSGIKFIDQPRLGPIDNLPFDMTNNRGHNIYYMLPLLLGIIGLIYQAYSGAKGIQSFWITFCLFFMTGIAIVLYLNQTPQQPRERDYAYVGSFYAFAVWIGLGVAGLAKALEKYVKAPPLVASIVASIACLLIPFQMAGQNWDDHDRSGRHIARDVGRNYLESCEPNAIIFTNGDNDTFPLWYAQEVEGIRTDIRVCNTSYIQTDWYADQMKRQAYNSDPLPISWPREAYIEGTRDYAYIVPALDKPVDLGGALNFLLSDDERTKRPPGFAGRTDYIPSQTLTYKVDSAAVIANRILSPKYESSMLKEMTINLKDQAHPRIVKPAIFIYDMLSTNNWKRPMYYAISVAPDQYFRLDPYFQQTGLAYQIVPLETGSTANSVNTEKMYDNLMNKFKWGGIDNINPETNPIRRLFKNDSLPAIYLEENTMRMCRSYRTNLFGILARALMAEGQDEKAIQVLDRCMEAIPSENVPVDHNAWIIAELYFRLGQKEKAESMFTQMLAIIRQNLNWYSRLRPPLLKTVYSAYQTNLGYMQQLLQIDEEMQTGFTEQYRQEFENYFSIYRRTFPTQGRN